MEIVAEIGSCHGGSLSEALRLMEAAKEAGADAVKFQYYRARLLWADSGKVEAMRRYEVKAKWLSRLKEKARELGLRLGFSVFAKELVKDLVGVADYLKVASGDILYHSLIGELAATGLPLVISTGMATPDEVRGAVKAAKCARDLTLLHCVCAYPASPKDYAISSALGFMAREFRTRVGVSDHTTTSVLATWAALDPHCSMLEKHFRLDSTPPCPDFDHSLPAREFRSMVEAVRRLVDQKEEILKKHSGLYVRESEMPLWETIRRRDDKPLRS